MELAAIITAVGVVLGSVGTGAWKLIDRADKKRERREIAVEELLKQRIAALEAEKQKESSEWAIQNTQLKKYCSKVKSFAGKWREQLIANGIQPDPADWPEEPEESNDD